MVRILFVLMLVSTTALCQTQSTGAKVDLGGKSSYPIYVVDTLKLPKSEAQKIDAIDKELKELMKDPEVQRLFMLQSIRGTVIESGFNHKGIPVPSRNEYSNGNVLYIKDEKATLVK